jgi:hypothetical protein
MPVDKDISETEASAQSFIPSGPIIKPPTIPSPGPAATPAECIPAVTSFDPAQSTVLKDITIFGQRFAPTAATCGTVNNAPVVTFQDSHPGGPINAAVKSFSDTQIVARVPNGAKTSGITVTNTKGNAASASGNFVVLPTIDSFSPLRGGVGTAVQLTGTALYNTPQFFFIDKNGADIPAAFSNPTLNTILVAVPNGAVSGPIKVITKGGGIAKSAMPFTVTVAVPQVSDIMPKFGAPGTKVSIFAKSGTKFESIQSVSFLTDPDAIGKARRIVLARSELTVSGDLTRIDVLVPDGAVTGKIRVTNESGSGTSVAFRVPLAAPSALAARSIADPKIELSWRDTTTTEVGFRLERSIGETDAGYVPIATLAPNTVSYVDANVTTGTTYRYRLFAFNSKEGDSAASNAATITAGAAIQSEPVRLLFNATRDSANPPSQLVQVTRSSIAATEQMVSISDNASWLTVSPGNGVTPGVLTASVDVFGLKSGRYPAVITVRSTGPTPSVVSIAAELTVKAPAGAITIVFSDEGVGVLA